MTKGRLEAFSDGVIAIIITIMVLEIKVPLGAHLEDITHLIPEFISYAMSFIFVLIYWNNHHHTFQAVEKVNGKVLLANGFLLFWLSLTPFVTCWMGKNNFEQLPVMCYGIVALISGFAYQLLTNSLIQLHGKDSDLAKAIGKDTKGFISLALYSIGVIVSFVNPFISCGLYLLVSIIWLIPDKRIEKTIGVE